MKFTTRNIVYPLLRRSGSLLAGALAGLTVATETPEQLAEIEKAVTVIGLLVADLVMSYINRGTGQ